MPRDLKELNGESMYEKVKQDDGIGDKNIFDNSKEGVKSERYVDDAKGLNVLVERRFLSQRCAANWYEKLIHKTRWFRVCYKSHRFEKECETPCWTAFYGGQPCYSPYYPIPPWLSPLVDQVSVHLSSCPFNAILLRLYFDGNDEIAWHTDGRKFLGDSPTIASLSLGASATFQMRRMNNVWPSVQCSAKIDLKTKDNGIDQTTPILSLKLNDGDLLVMSGSTQKHWHHRVPKERGRSPRININFRYIIQDGEDAERGQKSYYKYMVHGDYDPNEVQNISVSYQEIMAKKGGMMNFLKPSISQESCKHLTNKPCSSNKSAISQKNQLPLDNFEHEQKNLKNHESTQNQSCESKSNTLLDSKDNLKSGKKIDDKQLNSFLETAKDIDKAVFINLPYSIQKEIMLQYKSPQCHSKSESSQEHQIDPHVLCSKRPTMNYKDGKGQKKRKSLCTASSKTKSISDYFAKR